MIGSSSKILKQPSRHMRRIWKSLKKTEIYWWNKSKLWLRRLQNCLIWRYRTDSSHRKTRKQELIWRNYLSSFIRASTNYSRVGWGIRKPSTLSGKRWELSWGRPIRIIFILVSCSIGTNTSSSQPAPGKFFERSWRIHQLLRRRKEGERLKRLLSQKWQLR